MLEYIFHSQILGMTSGDPHTQYLNNTRGDARYYPQTSFIATSTGVPDAGKPILLDSAGNIDATMINDADIDHGNLTGLADDDHSQYPLLSGRAGGQNLNGGVAANEVLQVNSTSHATKGRVSIDSLNIHKIVNAQSVDANPIIIHSIAVAEGEVFHVEADIIGRKNDGTDRAVYKLLACVYRNALGNVTLQGAVIANAIESDANWDATIIATIATQTIDLQVTGVAATLIDWYAHIKYFKNE